VSPSKVTLTGAPSISLGSTDHDVRDDH